jgi:hypothetical protein
MAQSTTRGRSPRRSTTTAQGEGPRRAPGRPRRGAAEPVSAAPRRAPAVSKDELRAQLAKAERTNATLRTKNRDLKRAASEAAERIAELEREVSRHERRLARANRATEPAPASEEQEEPAADHDPGDAVPPGVAVQEPAPLSDEDQKVRDSLEEKLSTEEPG